MAAFDEICGCSYETETQVCVSMRRKWQARGACKRCLDGHHSIGMRAAAPSSAVLNNTAFVAAQRLSVALDGEQAKQALEALNGSIKEE